MVLRQSILGLGQMVMDHHHIYRFITSERFQVLVETQTQPHANLFLIGCNVWVYNPCAHINGLGAQHQVLPGCTQCPTEYYLFQVVKYLIFMQFLLELSSDLKNINIIVLSNGNNCRTDLGARFCSRFLDFVFLLCRNTVHRNTLIVCVCVYANRFALSMYRRVYFLGYFF